MIALWFLQLISMAPARGCVRVSQDLVLARDLAKQAPQFAALQPDLRLTFAPLPGTQRVLSRRDLAGLLHGNGVEPSGALSPICIERETAPLRESDLAAAIEEALNFAKDLHVEIVDYPRQPMPPGVLRFKPEAVSSRSLGRPDLPIMWPGRLVYDDRHSMSIWVKAVIWVEHKVVVAAEDLAPGKPIQPGSIRMENAREYPLGNAAAQSIDQVVGLSSRCPIRKGSPVFLSQLELPWVILRGDKVVVTVLAGSAHVSLEVVALSSGRIGDEIALRNPWNGRTFRAVVDAKGIAVVHQRDIL